MNIEQLAQLALDAPYSEPHKKAWKKESMRLLMRVRDQLNLSKHDYPIRFNAGGIAVPGDAIMHGPDLYISLSGTFGLGFARGVRDSKDYVGGQNLSLEGHHDFDAVVRICGSALERGKAMHR